MSTPHLAANKDDFAKVVLMPGDSFRARWIAETFLHDVKMVTHVRANYGYTGYTKNNKRISVLASGMGMPSISIYAHELFEHYGVEAIIRVGTCGSYSDSCNLGDIIIAQGACSNTDWMKAYCSVFGTLSAISDFALLRDAVSIAESLKLHYSVGNILSSNTFYEAKESDWKKWASFGVLGVEMEAYALFAIAANLKKKALAICTVSDSFLHDEILSPEEREQGLYNMANLGVLLAEKYAD